MGKGSVDTVTMDVTVYQTKITQTLRSLENLLIILTLPAANLVRATNVSSTNTPTIASQSARRTNSKFGYGRKLASGKLAAT